MPEIHYKMSKDEADNALNRIISFIELCDNKASVFLSALGVVIALIFTGDGITDIWAIFKNKQSNLTIFNYIYLTALILSVLAIACGFILLVSSLIARTNNRRNTRSKYECKSSIYFGDVAKCVSFSEYKFRLEKYNETDHLDDTFMQIYINSKIAAKKFKQFNIGVYVSGFGLCLLLIIWGVGHIT